MLTWGHVLGGPLWSVGCWEGFLRCGTGLPLVGKNSVRTMFQMADFSMWGVELEPILRDCANWGGMCMGSIYRKTQRVWRRSDMVFPSR